MLAPMIIETCSLTLIMREHLETVKEHMLAYSGTLRDTSDPATASYISSYASFASVTMALTSATMRLMR